MLPAAHIGELISANKQLNVKYLFLSDVTLIQQNDSFYF